MSAEFQSRMSESPLTTQPATASITSSVRALTPRRLDLLLAALLKSSPGLTGGSGPSSGPSHVKDVEPG